MTLKKSEWYFPRDWLWLLGFQVIIPVIGIIAACFLPSVSQVRRGDPTLFWIAVVFAFAGVLILFLAKLPLYRQGKFCTFGSRALPARHRRMYFMAYILIGLSFVMMLLLLAAIRSFN
jgi:hypothetical protein